MLRVSLVGNLGADPEARYSQKGTQVVSFRVAVNQVRTGPDGERQENTEWFRVRVASRLAEFAQRLSKGSRVLVIGRLDIGHYQSKDGEPRTSFDVWADDIQSMSSRAFGPEADGMQESEAEAQEPVGAGVSSLGGAGVSSLGGAGVSSLGGAGVSSLGGAGAGARAGANGKSARAAPRGEGARSGAAEELEDLPF